MKKLAASAKWTADPPSIRSRSPKGVRTASKAIDPTTVRAMADAAWWHNWRGTAYAPHRVPDDYIFGSVIALGYQGEPAALPDETMRAQETSARQRKQLEEFVLSAWDEPARLG